MNEGVHMDYIDVRQSITNIVAKEKPVVDISDLLFKHKCYYLLGLSSLAPEQRNKLDMMLAINEINIKTNYLCLENIFKIIANEHYAIVKGAVFSKAAYFKPNMRVSLDIDLMIHPSYISRIKDVFLGNGFTQGQIKGGEVVP